MKKLVYHHNLIGHEINESNEYFANDPLDREVYCRKLHIITEPLGKDCEKCQYFAGLEQGYGHECAWDDVEDTELVINHEDRYKEYERVDKLIKTGVLPTYANDTVAHVKCLKYDQKKWVYIQSEDRRCRFALGEPGKKNLICFGINPSTASPEDLDPTMRKVKAIATNNGYDGYIMLNIYPQRATDPCAMDKEPDLRACRENYDIIKGIFQNNKCDIVAAWGDNISKRNYLKDCLQEIVRVADLYDAKWYCLGNLTKLGNPRHPLYIRNDSILNICNCSELH